MTDEPHDPWTILSERRAYENPWIAIDHREVLTPKGAPGVYGIVRFKKVAVGVVPVEPDGSVHLVGQWRVPLGRYSWEIPEGGAEPGEAPAACARREMCEETGLEATRLVEILRLDLSNSCTDETAVVFLALGLKAGQAAPDDTESLTHKRLPFAEAFNQAISGEITDAISVAGLLRAYHMAKTGQIDAALAKAMLQGLA
ncbi:MAG TPA: NUDIX hydrolase [Caulobacterales bacterium]|jgi:8-oxo-dGTP pyrophosphatase MutT (NUDIX family)|nr:NUDIX hydrolase [Caulobacterales bacterium]